MANGRVNVGPPAKSALGYGLDSVAEIRPASSEDGRWKAGVTWENICPDANTTYDLCVTNLAVSGTGAGTPPAKAETADRSFWSATPFTVLSEIDCSAPGFWEQADENVRRNMDQASAYEVERVFWTGSVAGAPVAFPHLVANAARVEVGRPSITLQQAAAPVVTGGPFDPVEALGLLEAALGTCVKGVATIHMPVQLLPSFVTNHLVEMIGGVMYTKAGNKIAISAAYTGESPAGVLTAGTAWMYGTGPVFMYKSVSTAVGTREQSLDRSVDTLKRIYERTYLIGYDCCLFGVPVTTGGIDSGTPGQEG